MAGEWMIPFEYDYMVKAMCACALIGLTCGLLSAFLTLKGWSLMGDALSHAVVPGVAVAYIIGWPLALGSFFAGLFAAAAMAVVKAKSQIREDAVIGIVFTTFFAFGLLLIGLYPAQVDLKSIIQGNILGIADRDLWQVIGISVFCLFLICLKWRDLMLFCFDVVQAKTIGLRVGLLHGLLLGLVSAMAVAALQAVGAILVVAMLITPGATAYLLTDRFPRMMLLSALLGAVTASVGAYASYFINGSPGGCIVTLQTLVFLLCWIFAPKHGMLAQGRKRKRIDQRKEEQA
jgi:manganese/iron transport system permease protein